MAKKQTKKRKTPNTTRKAVKRRKRAKTAQRQTKKRVYKKRDIVISSPVNPDVKIMIASELADDEMIERELMGEVMPYFIYSFQDKGNKVTGLTVKGVNEVVRRLNRNKASGVKIRIHPKYKTVERNVDYDGVKGVEVSVYGENIIDGNSAWGIKFEPYMKPKKEGGTYKNTFAVEKALSKAERNAKRKLIPEVLATKMIEKLMQKPENVKQLNAPPMQQEIVQTTRPEPSTQAELETLVIDAINFAKDVGRIIDIDEKTQKSDKFNKEFKEKVHKLANTKANELDK